MSTSHRARSARCAIASAAVTTLFGLAAGDAAPAHAQKATWDRVGLIKKAAGQLADLQKARGALGAYEHISACYKTHSLASTYGQSFEACLILDYIHSKVTAAIYDRVPVEERQKAGAPDPKALLDAMSRRLGGGFSHYKIAEKDAQSFVALVEKHGVPAYSIARFGKDGAAKSN